MLDDFETGGGANALGGYPWAGGSGDGSASTSVTMTYSDGGPSSVSTKFAAITGTIVLGNDSAQNISWGLMNESLPNSNLSGYTGLSFDMRGQMNGFRVLAIEGNSPIQDHNANCTFTYTAVPACAIDQGTVIAGVTDGYLGSAPDTGAFESNAAPFAAGAQRSADASICGQVADIAASLPPQAPSSWTPETEPDAGVSDAGTTDAGLFTDAGAAQSKPDAGTEFKASGGGCDCKVASRASSPNKSGVAWGSLALAAGVGLGTRRRRGSSRKADGTNCERPAEQRVR